MSLIRKLKETIKRRAIAAARRRAERKKRELRRKAEAKKRQLEMIKK